LTTTPDGWRRLARKALGPVSERDNVQRESYNDRLRATFADREPIFDLAAVESSGAQGWFPHGGARHRRLSREFTDDGGHLNMAGRRAVAHAFINVLSRLGEDDS
jgi:hypothetical protein